MMTEIKRTRTARGFELLTFNDRSGTECTLQESSLATEAAIWFGAASLSVKRCPKDWTGWHGIDFATLFPGQDIVGNERMHLTQDHVRALLPILQHFADHGDLPLVAEQDSRALSDRAAMLRKIESVLNIPSAGHASAGELADTILDALGFTEASNG